jgi:polysaccharide export outer membrane protein
VYQILSKAAGWRAVLAAAVLAAGGCASSGTSPRLARYRPDVGATDRNSWEQAAQGTVSAASKQHLAGKGGVRRIRNGGRVSVSKLGIPQAEEIKDVVDDRGCINLSYIGTIKIAGLTTSEAEEAIEQAYVSKGYYQKITVVVVAEEDEYYVRGEVRMPGKYPLNAGMTLLRAITTAGGYTDYANPRKINVFRGDKVFRYDAKKIEALEAKDPLIEADDVVVVERGWSVL